MANVPAHELQDSRPLRLIFGSLLGFSLFISGVFIAMQWREVRYDEGTDLLYLSELVAQSTTADLKHYESLLTVLGQRLIEIGAHHHPEAGRPLMQQMIQVNDGMAGFGFAQADGQLLLISNIPPNTPLPSLTAQPESARSFRQALAKPGLDIGRSYFMPTLQRWVIPIRVALQPDDTTAEPQFVMTAGLNIQGGDSALNIRQMPDDVLIQIFRADGFLQFQNPVSHPDDYAALYNAPWPDSLLEPLRRIGQSPDPNHRGIGWHLPWPDGQQRMVGITPLPNHDLLVVVSRPMERFYKRWLSASMIPLGTLIMLSVMATLVYRHAQGLQHQLQKQWSYQATHDPLTHLPNRTLLADRLRQRTQGAPRVERLTAVMFVDLDGFRRFNDTYGHEVGDELLLRIAKRLGKRLPPEASLGRQGGDEFIVLLPEVDNFRDIETVAEELVKHFQRVFVVQDKELSVSTSIGIAVYPQDAQDANLLLRNAGTALHNAKTQRRGGFLFYNQTMNQAAQRRLLIENELRKALGQGELRVFYQPQMDILSGQIIGCEALLRWENPQLGTVSPAEFIPIAEDTGMITALGTHVLETACSDIATLQNQLKQRFTVSVNLSARQLLGDPIVQTISDCLAYHRLPAANLVTEVTESVFIHDFELARGVLADLRSLGTGVAIDDFGTGYSSLSYLNRLPVSEIKIDRAFVDGICNNPTDANLVRSILALGNALHLEVVAEGVETDAQIHLLQRFGCRRAQGYHIARPMPYVALLRYLGC